MHLGERTPIGILLWDASQAVQRAFDGALHAHGANRPVWFVFLALAQGAHPTQRELARMIGISEGTLTHHLTALEARGLVARRRDDTDRRIQRIWFTPEGEAAFEAMRDAAVAFDQRLRAAIGDDRLTEFTATLIRLRDLDETGIDEEPIERHARAAFD